MEEKLKALRKIGRQLAIFVLLVIALWLAMLLGGFVLSLANTETCYFRYTSNDQPGNTMTIPANGYNATSEMYGQWTYLNVINANKSLSIEVSGDVSLCQAELPINNIVSDNNLDRNNKPILIPKIGEPGAGIAVPLLAKNGCQWKNLAFVEPGDKVMVSLQPVTNAVISLSSLELVNKLAPTDMINTGNTFDCKILTSNYPASCGRYWNSASCITLPIKDSDLVDHNWVSAQSGKIGGLSQRIVRGSSASSAYEVTALDGGPNGTLSLLNSQFFSEGYLQYNLSPTSGSCACDSGGFILYLKQDKCVAHLGKPSSTQNNYGAIEYLLVDSGVNPNTSTQKSSILAVTDGQALISNNSTKDQYLWFRVVAPTDNYAAISGEYIVKFTETGDTSFNFLTDYLMPIVNKFTFYIDSYGIKAFNVLTCADGNTTSCLPFFLYVKIALTIYIVILGMGFALGMNKISQYDLLIHCFKILIVGGLINGTTYRLFNQYIYPLINNFVSEIVLNMNGYTASDGNAENFIFLNINPFLSRVILDPAFKWQLLALININAQGLIYFGAILIGILIAFKNIFLMIQAYIISKMAIAIFISLAPVFIVFTLFERSKQFFVSWVKLVCLYLVEPVVYMLGINILIKIYTIYLDFVLSYSVCWKCAINFSIPGISSVVGPIFCLHLLLPWGVDPQNSSYYTLDLPNFVALVFIAICMNSYRDLAHAITVKLTGSDESVGPLAVVKDMNAKS